MDKEKEVGKKPFEIKDVTICSATGQMLEKARRDGVETAFDRAANMKACPIGADSACCKHCFMGPLSPSIPKEPVRKGGGLRCGH